MNCVVRPVAHATLAVKDFSELLKKTDTDTKRGVVVGTPQDMRDHLWWHSQDRPPDQNECLIDPLARVAHIRRHSPLRSLNLGGFSAIGAQ